MSDASGSEKKSPGQAACEAFWAHLGTGPHVQPPSAAWDWAGAQGTREAWIAAARAAVEADACRAEALPGPVPEIGEAEGEAERHYQAATGEVYDA